MLVIRSEGNVGFPSHPQQQSQGPGFKWQSIPLPAFSDYQPSILCSNSIIGDANIFDWIKFEHGVGAFQPDWPRFGLRNRRETGGELSNSNLNDSLTLRFTSKGTMIFLHLWTRYCSCLFACVPDGPFKRQWTAAL